MATGNALTTPDNYLYSDAVVELSGALGVLGSNSPALPGTDADFGATPILFRPAGCPLTLVAASKSRASSSSTRGGSSAAATDRGSSWRTRATGASTASGPGSRYEHALHQQLE